jgi:Domain of unknown function (DUF1929)
MFNLLKTLLRKVIVFFVALFSLLLILTWGVRSQPALAQGTDPSIVGQWVGPFPWPLVPIDVSVGPNGKVLAWQRPKLAAVTNPPVPQSILWTPPNNTSTSFSTVPPVATDIFCAGHAFAPSGRLLVAGGHAGTTNPDPPGPPSPADVGTADTNVYTFSTNAWFHFTPPSPSSMGVGGARWYPTVTYLANGEAVVVGGTETTGTDVNDTVQVWNGTWRKLTTASLPSPPALNTHSNSVPFWMYPWNYLAPNGKLFVAGPSKTTRSLTTTGTGSWQTVGDRPPEITAADRYLGSSVMYDDGKVLIVGGSNTDKNKAPTITAEVIDLTQPNPRWLPVGSMTFARKHHNATLLPDGKVLVTGGTKNSGFNNFAGRVLAAEMWDPATTNWSTLASMSEARLYHSTAVLLPDGRVMVGGGGLPLGDGEPLTGSDRNREGHYNVEFYSPPYLFQGGQPAPRPKITSASTSVKYGQPFLVETLDPATAASIAKVNWIRLPSVTHGFDANQRINRLSYTQTNPPSKNLNVTAPSDPNLAPPGHYMLFILNSNGTPSEAKIIQLQPT